jgi:hypothetical protein
MRWLLADTAALILRISLCRGWVATALSYGVLFSWIGTFGGASLRGANFTFGDGPAVKFGVHEVALTATTPPVNPFDVVAMVRFVPPSGETNAKTAYAFFDGENTWRARVYANEAGEWTWTSACSTDQLLNSQNGKFVAIDSELRGRLISHPNNPRQLVTEDGKWFLNLSDTAYFLLCAHDGNGLPILEDDARRYVRDDVERGITALRCFLASHGEGFSESTDQWREWYFAEQSHDRIRLDKLQTADGRLRMLLDDYPEVAVQLIVFPLEAYNRDDRFWVALTAAQRERVLRNLVARFAAYPQLLWLVINDAHYGPGFPNNNAMAREVGAYLQKHDPWQHPRSTGHARRIPFYFGGEDWATYIHIEHAHDLGALEYARYQAFNKPVFLGEDRYEQDHGPKLDPMNMTYWQRRLFWAWLLSGGSANYGGRWWAVQPYSETGTRTATFHKRPDHTFREALTGLDSVRLIREYFEKRAIDLGDWTPDHALVVDGDGATGARAPRALRRGQDEFLIYHPNATADGQQAQVAANAPRLVVDLSAATGTYAGEWFRAESGESRMADEHIHGGQRVTLTAPWPAADVVVRLVRVAGRKR